MVIEMIAAASIPAVGFSLVSLVSQMISKLGVTVSLLLGGIIAFGVIRSAVSFFKSTDRTESRSNYYQARKDYYYNARYHRYAARRSARRAYRYRRRYYRYYRRG